jgi:dihydrofolate reductase/thymidylate synthase
MGRVNLIVACDNEFGIGITDNINDYIPWILKNDHQFFKATTLNKTIIMGRKTWNSLPIKPLKDRTNIIISSNLNCNLPNTKVIRSFDELELNNDVFVIGGTEVYKYFLDKDLVGAIYITYVSGNYNCNTFFPKEQFNNFINNNYITKTLIQQGEEKGIKYTIMKYERLPFEQAMLHELDNNDQNKDEESYLELLREVLLHGDRRVGRNGGTISMFGKTLTFNLENKFPLLTTKKTFIRGVFEELKFFIKGQTNSKILEEKGINIWKPNTTRDFLDQRKLHHYEEGDLGPMYGFNWRYYGAKYEGCSNNYNGKGYDQLYHLVKGLIEDPYSRRHVITTFNPSEVYNSVLMPCHGITIQFNVSSDNYLDCMMMQRSADLGLGVPFNIASYALLTYMIGEITGYKPRRLIMNFGDTHIYESHVKALEEQIKRRPYRFPFIRLKKYEGSTIEDRLRYLEELNYEDIDIIKYRNYPVIKMDMVA